MMEKSLIVQFFAAALLRYWLAQSSFKPLLQEKVEISTPINAWKNLIEGITLMEDGIDPYSGDMFHESPLILHGFYHLLKLNPSCIPFVFILGDILAGVLLYYMAKSYMKQLLDKEEKSKKEFSTNVSHILINPQDANNIPFYVALAYLYNPFSILNCVSFTSTVLLNLFTSLFFFSFVNRSMFLSSLAIALTVLHNIYPITLIVPACIHFHQHGRSWKLFVFTSFLLYSGLIGICYILMGFDFSFLGATYGFQLSVPNLQPNIGLFWYFFTEMFEHFRVLFIVAFQINAIALYVIPLSLRLHKEPVLVAFCLTGLATVFKSYPGIGDVALYLSLIPLSKHLFSFMQQGFVVACFFIGCSIFAPTMWHLWIYSRSANANFYFGVTLAFATSQIFLMTDLLFAYLKRDYTLRKGDHKFINGKPARLVLE